MRAIGRRLFVQLSPASPVGQESLGLHPAGRDVARSAQPTAMAACEAGLATHRSLPGQGIPPSPSMAEHPLSPRVILSPSQAGDSAASPQA
jgi:hypothetical protein